MRITIGNAHLDIHPCRARLLQRNRAPCEEEGAVVVHTDAVDEACAPLRLCRFNLFGAATLVKAHSSVTGESNITPHKCVG